jgi:hypothetical protein
MSIKNIGNLQALGTTGLSYPVSTVEYLVVAGGGNGGSGGGGILGGGGGAGGLLTGTGYPVSVGVTYVITIGAGNAPETYPGRGGTSSFDNISTVGGGNGPAGGGTYGNGTGNGGSGGGGIYGGDDRAYGTPGQGNNGGLGANNTIVYVGGGGGGAGSVGGNGNGSTGGYAGAGGTGIVSSITGIPVQYAGGGGGGIYYPPVNTKPAPGGGGGGGAGNGTTGSGAFIRPTYGLANTGGGGGGSHVNTNASQGGGGSGIVVIRYPSYLALATQTTGSPQTYIAGAWRVYVFTSSGTIKF